MREPRRLCPLAVVLACAGCDVEDACDPGQVEATGMCFDTQPADAGPDDDAAPECSETYGAERAGAGDPCASAADCTCVATFCVLRPGAPEGYCTTTGCLEDAEVCPPKWGCTDLSTFDPKLPSICARPE